MPAGANFITNIGLMYCCVNLNNLYKCHALPKTAMFLQQSICDVIMRSCEYDQFIHIFVYYYSCIVECNS